MNTWVRRSVELANAQGYLDRLLQVYPVGMGADDKYLSSREEDEIREVIQQGKGLNIVQKLLTFTRFPYNEPYVECLRAYESALPNNPATVKRIADKLQALGPKSVIDGLNRDKMDSRKFGQAFRNWTQTNDFGIPVLPESEFLKCEKIALLAGGDAYLSKFANNHYSYKRDKGLDIVAIAYGTPVVGEVKFISRGGGAQNGGFREAISFVKEPSGKAQHIAVVDGIVWSANTFNPTRTRTTLFGSLATLNENQPVLSALLLREYLESFKPK